MTDTTDTPRDLVLAPQDELDTLLRQAKRLATCAYNLGQSGNFKPHEVRETKAIGAHVDDAIEAVRRATAAPSAPDPETASLRAQLAEATARVDRIDGDIIAGIEALRAGGFRAGAAFLAAYHERRRPLAPAGKTGEA